MDIRVGTAGWSVTRQVSAQFPTGGSLLERYGAMFNAVEINTSFYRAHKHATYSRWAVSVPKSFRFGVKMPREITHERKLVSVGRPLDRFIAEARALGEHLGPLLVQLPSKFAL